MFNVWSTFDGFCSRLAMIGVACVFSSVALAATQPADRTQSLIDATRTQFELAYRLHPRESRLRLDQLNVVVATWKAAPRTGTNQERLQAWLRAALRASMPGSKESLPPAPTFIAAVQIEKPVEKQAPQVVSPIAKPIQPAVVAKPVLSAPPRQNLAPKPAVSPKPTPAVNTAHTLQERLPSIKGSDFDDFMGGDPFQDDPVDATQESAR